jgi:hypothetical protein
MIRTFLVLLAAVGLSSTGFAQDGRAKTIHLSQQRDAECIHVRIDAGWATIEVSMKRLRGIAGSAGADAARAKRLVTLYDSTPNKSGCVLLFNIWNVAAVADSGYLVGDLVEKGEAVVFVDADRPEKEAVIREVTYPDTRMKLFSLKDGRGFFGYQTGVR